MISAIAFFPIFFTVLTKLSARAKALSKLFIKAPEPHLTSKQNASEPSAIFLERMLDVIRGIDSTVPVTSRKEYKRRSAGAIVSVCPIIAKPHFSIVCLNSSVLRFVL